MIPYAYRSTRSFPLQMDRGAAGITEQGRDENNPRIQLGWNSKRTHYRCRGGRHIAVPRRTASVRELDETKTASRNMIRYRASKKELSVCISGIECSNDIRKIFGGPDDVRTIIFPEMVRTVRQGSFRGVKSLRSVVLNEGLEVLGTEEHSLEQFTFCGVFQESGVKRVKLSSTLKVIKNDAFMGCTNLRSVRLPDGLTEIGLRAFRESGLENITTP